MLFLFLVSMEDELDGDVEVDENNCAGKRKEKKRNLNEYRLFAVMNSGE